MRTFVPIILGLSLFICLVLPPSQVANGRDLVLSLDESYGAEVEDIAKKAMDRSNVYTIYVKFKWKAREDVNGIFVPFADKSKSGLATTSPMISEPEEWKGDHLRKVEGKLHTFWKRLPNQGSFSVWECKLQRTIQVPQSAVLISEEVPPKPDNYHSYREMYVDLGGMKRSDSYVKGGQIGKLTFHQWEINEQNVRSAVDSINKKIKTLSLSSVDRNSRAPVTSTFTLTLDSPNPREAVQAYLKTSNPSTVSAALKYLKPYKDGKFTYEGARIEVLILVPANVKLVVVNPHYHFVEGSFKVEGDLEKTVHLSDIGAKIRIERDGKTSGSFIE